VPLTTFVPALDRLASACSRLAVPGKSFGAEAALLVGVHDHRADAVAWDLARATLPYVAFDPTWATGPAALRRVGGSTGGPPSS
jgi:hypothetical protein